MQHRRLLPPEHNPLWLLPGQELSLTGRLMTRGCGNAAPTIVGARTQSAVVATGTGIKSYRNRKQVLPEEVGMQHRRCWRQNTVRCGSYRNMN